MLLLLIVMDGKLIFIDRILKQRWLTHLLFWIIVMIVQSQVFLYSGRTFYVVVFNNLAIMPSILIAAYFLSYYQIPKLVFKKRYVLFILSLIISIYCLTVLARLLVIFFAEPILGIVELTPKWELLGRVFSQPDRLLRNYLFSIYLGPILMTIIKLIKIRNEEKSRLDTLEKEKTITELNFLKTQIHPHFLLNTLNNIYALSLKKSDLTPESILKLSEMLTYVLYKCNDKYVLLTDEIELLKNYISLEQLRYGDELSLTFDKNIEKEGQKIAPLILLSIVENAFKHGVSGDILKPVVKIDLHSGENEIKFKVYNTKNPEKFAGNSNVVNGIGSYNVQKQLSLVYPEQHSIQIVDEADFYEIEIIIQLN